MEDQKKLIMEAYQGMVTENVSVNAQIGDEWDAKDKTLQIKVTHISDDEIIVSDIATGQRYVTDDLHLNIEYDLMLRDGKVVKEN